MFRSTAKKRIVLFVCFTFLAVLLRSAPAEADDLKLKLKTAMEQYRGRYRILYETYRTNNFEIFVMDPDGSNRKNLTNTPDVHEFFPQGSPDGKKICFVAYQDEGEKRIRCLYLMNSDGSGRKKIVENGRWPCWSPKGDKIAFLMDYLPRFSIKDYANKGLYFYDVKTGAITEHPNKNIKHIFNLSWHPGGKWIAATVHGSLGFGHGVIALDTEGYDVLKLWDKGCRPNFNLQGNKLTWSERDWAIAVVNIETSDKQIVSNEHRRIVETEDHDGMYTYHPEFSPDGKFILFSRGPVGPDNPVDAKSPGSAKAHHAIIGVKADKWDICVVPSGGGPWIKLTTDGNSNKEPNWIKVVEGPGK
ncbi:MAG: PD40 domain-containing protein [Sedimentisphaerales bacterium]|nr:PD40 domain-containing protein [Sedimentisphaerales bacterium]